jgi:hypothetical protein
LQLERRLRRVAVEAIRLVLKVGAVNRGRMKGSNDADVVAIDRIGSMRG